MLSEIQSLGNPPTLLLLQKFIDITIEFEKNCQSTNNSHGVSLYSQTQHDVGYLIKQYCKLGKFCIPYYELVMAKLCEQKISVKKRSQSNLMYHTCYTSHLYLPHYLLAKKTLYPTETSGNQKKRTGAKTEIAMASLNAAVAYIENSSPTRPQQSTTSKQHRKKKRKQQCSASKNIVQACPKKIIAKPVIEEISSSIPSDLMFEGIEKALKFQQEWFARIKAAIHDNISLQRTLRDMHHEYKSLKTILDPILELNNTHIPHNNFFDIRHIRKVLMLTLSLPEARLKSNAMARSLQSILDSAYSDEAQSKEIISFNSCIMH